MSQFHVRLFREVGLPFRHLEDTAAWFQRFPGPIDVKPEEPEVSLVLGPSGRASWLTLFFTLTTIRVNNQVPGDDFVVLLSRSPNEENWFAAEDPVHPRNAFGHVEDFSYVTPAPADVVSAHYIIKGIFNVVIKQAEVDTAYWHDVPRGCLFDFCQLKTDLAFKLRTADICGDCLTILRASNVPDDLIAQTVAIMEAQRRTAVNTGPYLQSEAGFSRWAFPVAITRHKAVQARNPLLRLMALIDHFDSLVRYCYFVNAAVEGRAPELPQNPSLGWWVEQLAQLPAERFRNAVRIAGSEHVVHLRNERRGHGYVAADEDAYADDAKELQQALADIERELRPYVEDYKLFLFKSTRLAEGRLCRRRRPACRQSCSAPAVQPQPRRGSAPEWSHEPGGRLPRTAPQWWIPSHVSVYPRRAVP